MSHSQSAFSNLMNQYGQQAEQQKLLQAKAERRSETVRKVRSTIILVLLIGAFAAAAYYHNEVTIKVSQVMEKAFFKTPYAEAQKQTESKVADIRKAAEKNNEAIEGTFK